MNELIDSLFTYYSDKRHFVVVQTICQDSEKHLYQRLYSVYFYFIYAALLVKFLSI